MIISILGYMGSGKTLISKTLSEKINFNFLDTDLYISSKLNCSIEEIFKKKGEIYFRKLEKQCLEEILSSSKNTILSLGGGLPVYYNNMKIVNEYSESFFLKTPVPTLVERLIKNRNKRPLISHISDENLPEFIAKHLFERNPYYNLAKHHISTQNKEIEQIVEEIILHLPALNP